MAAARRRAAGEPRERAARGGVPLVAIIGRPNVGKSSLLNRLVQRREAIVDEQAGVTRDRVYERCEFAGREFELIDTGGISAVADDPLSERVKEQALAAVAEADLILFVVDVRAGVTAEDEGVARLLKRSGKPVIVVANKAEREVDDIAAHELVALGFGEAQPVSALHGIGTGDLLERVVHELPAPHSEAQLDVEASLSIVGRPNSGKSSLLNALVAEERALVSEMPGTTRDAIDSVLEYEGRRYLLIDTAGIRRKSVKSDPLMYFSYLRALRAVERSDLAFLVIDAGLGVTREDQKIARLIEDKGRACVVLLNKWDLVKGEEAAGRVAQQLETLLHFLAYAPVLRVSARTGRGLDRVMRYAEDALASYRRRVPTGELNRWFDDIRDRGQAAYPGARSLRIYYATQVDVAPPTFVFFVNDRSQVKPHIRRFLENELRDAFSFVGTPIRVFFKNRGDR